MTVILSSNIFESLPAVPFVRNVTLSGVSDSSSYFLSLKKLMASSLISFHSRFTAIRLLMKPSFGYMAETAAKNIAIFQSELYPSSKMALILFSTAPISTSTVMKVVERIAK